MDTRGTQTDLVTDRNIADCLMELKSSAEFQDLTYRLSRSCTGEMTLTVTRDSSVGLLGVPFDPAFATITASGLCYFSVLFTPVEVTNLKPNGDLNLRKFRHILWKLTGRAGYGFCPGFKDSDFPESFGFEGHGLEVLKQPFTRVQAKDCHVFLQLKRSSSRAVSQPLGLQLCSKCLKVLSDVYTSVQKSGEDLSRYPAFAKFLPAHSHPAALKNHVLPGGSSKWKEADEQTDHSGKAGHLKAEEEGEADQLYEDGDVSIDSPNLCVASEYEVVTDNSTVEKPRIVKSSSSQPPVKDCRVLLDRFIPGTEPLYKAGNKSKMVGANGSISANSSPVASPSSHSLDRASSAGSCPLDLAYSSRTSCSLVSSSSSPVTSNSSAHHLKQTSGENCLSKPVLSARIKPFRTVAPQGQDAIELNSTDSMETDVALAAGSSDVLTQREVKMEKEGPPVLSPEMYVCPADSPQPLYIDEDADPDDLELASNEPDAKRPCYRCSLCEEGFQTEAELQQHFSQRHPQDGDAADQSVTLDSSDLVTDEAVHSDAESPHWKVCPVCRKSYSTKEQLEAHLTDRHRTRLHRCRFCGQKFALKKNLADHLERHRGSKRLTCKECGSKFSKKKDFAAHVREHMGSFPYFCTICSKLFSRESVYEEHMERHRAKRGVRAVLSGSEKTLQGIVTKAKKCLEEKALMAPASTSTASATTLVNDMTKASATDSVSTSTSESVTCPPSNLHLLSAVSLAQAELDRQTTVDSSRLSSPEEVSVGVMKSTDAAAQLLHLSSAKLEKAAIPVSDPVSDSVSADSLEDTKQAAVIVKQGPEEPSDMIEMSQSLSAASQEQISPSVSETAHSSASSSQHSVDTGLALTQTGPSAETGLLQPDSEGGSQGGSMKEKLLVEREEKLKQKERELREREQDITRKNMLFFQQLLLAQMSHQPKNGSGAPAVSGEQGKGDKPVPQQAMVMAAMKSMAARGGALPVLRPPHPGAEVKPGQTPMNFLGGHLPFPVPAQLARPELELSKSSSLPQSGTSTSPGRISAPSGKARTICSPAGAASPSTSQSPHATVLGPRPPVVPPKQSPLASPRFPPPPPPPGVRIPHRSPTGSPQSPSTSSTQRRTPAIPPRRDTFLDLLMGLESKMPESVREFMPPPAPKCKLSRPHQPAFPSNKGAGVILHAETPESMARAMGSKGKGRWTRTKGLDEGGKVETVGQGGSEAPPAPPKKQSRWSGGLVKEQLNSVVTVVPPQEMKRLMSLTKDLSPAPTPTSEGAAPSTSSASLASPPAHSPVSSSKAGSSGQPSPAAPSPSQTTQGPPSAASTESPASHSSSARSPSPSPNPRSMPRLVPASALAAASSQIMPWLPKSSTASLPEETGPIDLTKGSSSKRAASEKRSEENKPEGEEAQQSVVLRHILLDPAVSQSQASPARQSVASGRTSVPDAPGPGIVSASGSNAQAAAQQAQLQASLQAAFRFKSKGNSLPQPFLPGMAAQQVPLTPPQTLDRAAPHPTEPVQIRAGQPPPLPGFLPQGLLLPGGRLPPPPPAIHSPPDRAQLLAPQFIPGGPVCFVPPPSNARRSPSNSAVRSSSGLSPSSLASPPSAVLIPGAAAVSSQARTLSTASSSVRTSPSHLRSPPQNVVSPPRSTIPNFLLPECEGAVQGLKRAGQAEEESKPAVNPLGGFAWHRPATVDPFLTAESNTTAPNLEGARGDRQDQNVTEEVAIDLSEDQNLWQQQFLQTLREKRRQQQEQLFMQQHRQQVLATNHHMLQNGGPPAKRGRRPKKNTAEAVLVEGGTTHYTGSINSQHALSLAGASTSDIIAAQAQASTAKRPRAKTGRGRPRGRPRKNAAQHIVVEAAVEPARTGAEVEEGTELQGFGSRVEVKVEPLEAGVTCDACSKVLYSESEILEHDCDSH